MREVRYSYGAIAQLCGNLAYPNRAGAMGAQVSLNSVIA